MAEAALFHTAQGQTAGFHVFADGLRAVGALPNGLVYAGFSLGGLPAQKLAQTRPGARGALLFDACVPSRFFGSCVGAARPTA